MAKKISYELDMKPRSAGISLSTREHYAWMKRLNERLDWKRKGKQGAQASR